MTDLLYMMMSTSIGHYVVYIRVLYSYVVHTVDSRTHFIYYYVFVDAQVF